MKRKLITTRLRDVLLTDPTAAEVIIGLFTLTFGLILLLATDGFNTSLAYALMAVVFVEEWIAGLVFIALGLLILFSTIHRTHRLRIGVMFLSGVIWVGLSTAFFLSVRNTASADIVMALGSFWALLRLVASHE